MKRNIESLKKFYKEHGYELLDSIYKNNKSNLTLLDNDGYLYYQSLNSFLKNKKPVAITKFNPYVIHNMNKYIEINNISTKLISSEVANIKSDKLEFKCACGVIYKTTWGEFVRDDKHRCMYCSGRIIWSLSEIEKYIRDNDISVKLLSEKYVSYDEKLKFECECGENFYVSLHHFIHSKQTRCQGCSQSQSYISKKTEDFLINNNIKYIKEFKFLDCKYKKELPFDYAILNSNGDVFALIEVDGEQHYNKSYISVDGKAKAEDRLNMIIYRDRLKDEYCFKNNVKLIRLAYWEFNKKENYKSILKNEILN